MKPKLKIKSIQELSDWMKDIQYGWMDKDHKKYIDYDNFYDDYRMLLPYEVEKYKVGVCWDQTVFENFMFDEYLKYEHHMIFIQQYEMSTHTFLTFKDKGKWYVFENSFAMYRGIHGPYKDIKEVVQNVYEKMEVYKKCGKGYQWCYMDPKKFTKKLTCKQFLDSVDYDWSRPEKNDAIGSTESLSPRGTNMKPNPRKRKAVEAYILQLCNDIDKTGDSAKRYTKMFKSMSDSKFTSWMVHIKNGTSQLNIMLPNMSTDITVDDAVKVAKKRKVNIFSRINFNDGATGRKYLTEHSFLVVRLPIRRLSQYLFHKISLPESDRNINPVSGQVIPPDKGAALSAIEVQILASKGLESSVVELIKVRGGDTDAYNSLKYQLEEEGRSSLAELPMEGRPRSAVTSSIYLRAMGISNNL